MKVYCMKLTELKTKDGKTYYKAFCFSEYGFTFDLFLDKSYFDYFSEIIEERGFADITENLALRYDKKLDKLVYYFVK